MKIEPIISSTAGWCEVRGRFVLYKIFLELHSEEKVLKRSPKQPKKMETRFKMCKTKNMSFTLCFFSWNLHCDEPKVLAGMSSANVTSFKINLRSSENQVLQFKGPLHSSKFILKDVMDTRWSWRGKLRVLHPQLNTLTSIQTTSSPCSLFSQESRLTVSSAEDEVSLMSPSPKEAFGSHIRCQKTFTCRWWCRNTTTKTPHFSFIVFPTLRSFSFIYICSHAAHVTWVLKKNKSRFCRKTSADEEVCALASESGCESRRRCELWRRLWC